ncbi:MAG: Bifunctional enzyme IspD/IspF [Alphaproteobacteria bacterium MarineAlpha5_Bin9]|nr:MAG: Bifunctional enzyme IspD/IspF [Alphaproteobacteria bacterium MarineAlpha5_Bin9]
MKNISNSLILLAGGKGKRLKNSKNIPKQYINYGNSNIIELFLNNLDHNIFDIIIIVCENKYKKKYLSKLNNKFPYHNIHFTLSGKNRQESSKNGILYLERYNPKKVLIHDSARPFATNKIFKRIINNLQFNDSCIPYIKSNDLLINTNRNIYFNNKDIIQIQTPQGFKFNKIKNAHKRTKNFDAKDDGIIFSKIYLKNKLIKGEKSNIKITENNDLIFLKLNLKKDIRTGIGYDIHRINYNSNKKLTLCGVKINHKPLIGHSDADVVYHSICDAIFGSLSMRDIGYYFNNKNKKWKNANSLIFLKFAQEKISKKNYNIKNIDINIICETPKINKYIILMKKNLIKYLKIKNNQISIKATTNEKVGDIGKGKAIASQSVITIEKNDSFI